MAATSPDAAPLKRACRGAVAATLLACLLAAGCDAGAGVDDAGTAQPAMEAIPDATAAGEPGIAPAAPSSEGDTPVASDDPASAPPAEPAGAPGGRAYVDAVEVMILESFPLQVRVGVSGNLSDACTHLAAPQVRRQGDTFLVALPTTRDEGMCAQVLTPFETTVELPVAGLPRGTYTVDVEGATASFTFDRDNRLP